MYQRIVDILDTVLKILTVNLETHGLKKLEIWKDGYVTGYNDGLLGERKVF